MSATQQSERTVRPGRHPVAAPLPRRDRRGGAPPGAGIARRGRRDRRGQPHPTRRHRRLLRDRARRRGRGPRGDRSGHDDPRTGHAPARTRPPPPSGRARPTPADVAGPITPPADRPTRSPLRARQAWRQAVGDELREPVVQRHHRAADDARARGDARRGRPLGTLHPAARAGRRGGHRRRRRDLGRHRRRRRPPPVRPPSPSTSCASSSRTPSSSAAAPTATVSSRPRRARSPTAACSRTRTTPPSRPRRSVVASPSPPAPPNRSWPPTCCPACRTRCRQRRRCRPRPRPAPSAAARRQPGRRRGAPVRPSPPSRRPSCRWNPPPLPRSRPLPVEQPAATAALTDLVDRCMQFAATADRDTAPRKIALAVTLADGGVMKLTVEMPGSR